MIQLMKTSKNNHIYPVTNEQFSFLNLDMEHDAQVKLLWLPIILFVALGLRNIVEVN